MADWAGRVFLEGKSQPYDYAYFIFQAVFAGTAATIVSGAVAESACALTYLISTVIIGADHPLYGHWAEQRGLAVKLNFVDFATGRVHSIGRLVGLAGALVLGPRLGQIQR